MSAPGNQIRRNLSLAQQDRLWGLAAAGVIVIGCLGPWATNGITSLSGLEGDGVVNLGAAVLAGFLVLIGHWTTLVGVIGALSAIGGAITAVRMEDVYEFAYGSPSPGWGLIVSIIGGIGLAAWAWWLPRLVGARPHRPVP